MLTEGRVSPGIPRPTTRSPASGEETFPMIQVGEHVSFRKLRKQGFSQCPTGKGKDFQYWFNGDTWLKVVDSKVVRIFTE
jgi:hypothetical protein